MVKDFTIRNEGSIFLVYPENDYARRWLKENVNSESLYFGEALVCEHRFIDMLLAGMHESGLTY